MVLDYGNHAVDSRDAAWRRFAGLGSSILPGASARFFRKRPRGNPAFGKCVLRRAGVPRLRGSEGRRMYQGAALLIQARPFPDLFRPNGFPR